MPKSPAIVGRSRDYDKAIRLRQLRRRAISMTGDAVDLDPKDKQAAGLFADAMAMLLISRATSRVVLRNDLRRRVREMLRGFDRDLLRLIVW